MSHLKSKNYLNITELIMSHKDRYGPLARLPSAIMDGYSELIRCQKEEIALFASDINNA